MPVSGLDKLQQHLRDLGGGAGHLFGVGSPCDATNQIGRGHCLRAGQIGLGDDPQQPCPIHNRDMVDVALHHQVQHIRDQRLWCQGQHILRHDGGNGREGIGAANDHLAVHIAQGDDAVKPVLVTDANRRDMMVIHLLSGGANGGLRRANDRIAAHELRDRYCGKARPVGRWRAAAVKETGDRCLLIDQLKKGGRR